MMTKKRNFHPDNLVLDNFYILKIKDIEFTITLKFKRMFTDDDKKLTLLFHDKYDAEHYVLLNEIKKIKPRDGDWDTQHLDD